MAAVEKKDAGTRRDVFARILKWTHKPTRVTHISTMQDVHSLLMLRGKYEPKEIQNFQIMLDALEDLFEVVKHSTPERMVNRAGFRKFRREIRRV